MRPLFVHTAFNFLTRRSLSKHQYLSKRWLHLHRHQTPGLLCACLTAIVRYIPPKKNLWSPPKGFSGRGWSPAGRGRTNHPPRAAILEGAQRCAITTATAARAPPPGAAAAGRGPGGVTAARRARERWRRKAAPAPSAGGGGEGSVTGRFRSSSCSAARKQAAPPVAGRGGGHGRPAPAAAQFPAGGCGAAGAHRGGGPASPAGRAHSGSSRPGLGSGGGGFWLNRPLCRVPVRKSVSGNLNRNAVPEERRS